MATHCGYAYVTNFVVHPTHSLIARIFRSNPLPDRKFSENSPAFHPATKRVALTILRFSEFHRPMSFSEDVLADSAKRDSLFATYPRFAECGYLRRAFNWRSPVFVV